MIYTLIDNVTGKPLQEISGSDLSLPYFGPDKSWVEGACPGVDYCWNAVNESWMPMQASLEELKLAAWQRIKAIREMKETSTFTHNGQEFDMDPIRIAGAVMDAREALINSETFSQNWVLTNNTVITMTAEETIAMGRAAKAVVSGLWETSQYLRMMIEAATTPAEVAAVQWPT